ncbi:calcium/sodium antiporter [Fulvivirga sediminis]|uniref:Calcium/sodium antiporter n=1 Tax=Fulvivirga sediminis TaxID=2803949 RepID=A0A937FA01_9BACT|nr:calcium/sodium antiporter [Fulvivirga sediminis]MBL3657727.1 calcium/sodium antiporter [Fulvivirga sediminis]
MITYFLFAIGFVLLIKGADYLVIGASSIAKRFKISEMIIGLTIVSFGTSLPELLVNLSASFRGSSEIAIGNIFGSNIANILLILGVSAVIRPLPITKNIYFSEIPFSLIATLLVGFLANAALFSDSRLLTLSRLDGIILLVFFSLFMGYIYVVHLSNQSKQDVMINTEEILSVKKTTIYVFGGLIALYFGGEWVVEGSIKIAEQFGLSETFIGLTVIAIGTSLPELFTSAVAAYRNNTDIAVGNVVGSNIFNLLWILGISAVIRPLPFDVASNTDIVMIIIASALLLFAVAVGRGAKIVRWEGMLFMVVYIGYIYYLVQRG